jgi:hypothetical protein
MTHSLDGVTASRFERPLTQAKRNTPAEDSASTRHSRARQHSRVPPTMAAVEWTRDEVILALLAGAALAALLLALGIAPIWLSSSPISIPLGVLSAAVAITVFHLCVSGVPDAPIVPAIVSGTFSLAPLTLLSMSYPGRPSALRRSPDLASTVYAAALVLSLVVLTGYYRSSTVWQLCLLIAGVVAAAAWVALTAASVRTLKLAHSPASRAHGRAMLWGIALSPATVAFLGVFWEADRLVIITCAMRITTTDPLCRASHRAAPCRSCSQEA